MGLSVLNMNFTANDMDIKGKGATSPHGGETPKSNNFSGKVNDSVAEMQTQALESLRDIVNHPIQPEYEGMLTTMPMNQLMQEVSALPKPVPLIEGLWNVGELATFFGISNCGKSIVAVEWADRIARSGKRTLYADFELSRPQFYQRYTNENGESHQFPSALFRTELDCDKYLGSDDFESEILSELEHTIVKNDIEVVIIDNLTFLSNRSEKSDSAGLLMLRLKALKERLNISMLVVSHTPKRGSGETLDVTSMAGSMRLANFFQVMIGLGKSTSDEKIKYIKSVKYRASEIRFGSDNVIMGQLSNGDNNNFPHFEVLGYCSERSLLREVTEKSENDLVDKARQLQSEGKSQRQIATELRISLGKVNKILKV